jgi:hypothetical protein
MAFDSLNFVSDAGKNIGSMVTGSASSLTSKLGSTISGLSKSGLSLDGLKSVASSKLDSLSNSLNPDTSLSSNFARVSPSELLSSRSNSQTESGDPATAINASQNNQKSQTMEYPLSRDIQTDFMKVKFSKYVRPSAVERGTFNTEMEICLPLPRDLRDTHSVQLNAQATSIVGAMAGTLETLGKELQAKNTSLSMKDYLTEGGGIGYYAAKAAVASSSPLGMSGEQIADTFGQFIGAIPNPHISLFFNGVDIRGAIEFSWLFSPKNAAESMRIKEIIREFKSRTLPSVTNGSGNIMGYPNMVEIELYPWADTNDPTSGLQTMPIYKRGMIESINVNYTPTGLTLFKDDNPVFVIFSFLFQEIEVFTANDFGGNSFDVNQVIEKFEPVYDGLKKAGKSGTSLISNATELFKS